MGVENFLSPANEKNILMSCLFRIRIVKSITQKEGGNTIVNDLILTPEEFHKIEDQISENSHLEIISNNDIHEMFNVEKHFKSSFIKNLMNMNHNELMKKLLSTEHQIVDVWGDSIAHNLISSGYKFSLEDIIKLKNIGNFHGETLAHFAVRYTKRRFSIDELIEMKNPPNDYGLTVAHFMAESGHVFTTEELIKIGNPSDYIHKTSVAYIMIFSSNINFSVDDL